MIVKCSNCHQIISEKDFESHKCNLPLKECKIIEVAEILDGSYGDKKLMNGWGTDGILYTFEVVARKAIPMIYPSTVNMKGKSPKKLPEPRGEILINLSERLHLATS